MVNGKSVSLTNVRTLRDGEYLFESVSVRSLLVQGRLEMFDGIPPERNAGSLSKFGRNRLINLCETDITWY